MEGIFIPEALKSLSESQTLKSKLVCSPEIVTYVQGYCVSGRDARISHYQFYAFVGISQKSSTGVGFERTQNYPVA